MNNVNKVSQSIAAQAPDFIGSEYPLLVKFVEYYYRSQEKTGLGQNIISNFLNYLDIDKLDVSILDGSTKLVEAITDDSDTIVVESVDKFLENNGTILIGDEIIYYESTTSSPNIALSPGISYEQVRVKWTTLENLIDAFDGTTRTFQLLSLGNPITPPAAQFLIVSLYGQILYPETDYQVSGTTITFTNAPRARTPSDSNDQTYIYFQKGFIENSIVAVDNISGSFGEGTKTFKLTRNGDPYEPITDEFVIAIYDNQLLAPRQQFFIDGDLFIFEEAPLKGKILSLYSIEAPIPSFGVGALGYARINNNGELTSISNSETGSDYRFEYPPKVSISSEQGSGGSATALINGVKTISLLDGGFGYSDTNPPIVEIEEPTKEGSLVAGITAEVTNGSVSALRITSSGSGYTFTPRVTFKQPGGAKLAAPTLSDGQISGNITITDGGSGYTTPPVVYVDEPLGSNPIKASFRSVLTNGVVTSIEILNRGQGYTEVPRIAIVDPTGAQVLQTRVDGDGRVIGIDLLSGGSGYDNVPSVYIVDNRTNGGTGAQAVASIFNGQITDINITNFGSGYSAAEPPTIFIQDPPSAKASVTIGLNEVTGYSINKSGSGYLKSQFLNCARAASGITKYTEDGNAVFSNDTMAMAAAIDTDIKCLDSLFVKRLLDKYTEQFLPDVPELDYKSIDVRNAIKTVRDFYQSKGTSFSISYLFKLLYGENISVSYPKDQIIKPSASTWSIDTVLRATLVSGNAADIRDGVLTQDADIADPNIQAASALVENYIAINTSTFTIYELVLSEETIEGTFTVPYKTRLAEPLTAEDTIITVDSTVGWPERNGQFLIGGTEVVQYKEKSLNQFIECTRGEDNTTARVWDAATEVTSNFRVFINKGTATEVQLNVVGIVDAEQTTLTDTGSYYLPGDKLSISKLGGTSTSSELTTWLYNVKKLIEVDNITFNNNIATVTCENPHGVLVGDQVTIYGANPIIYNGTFLVTSRDSDVVFQYQLPQPAVIAPQGNILVSIDLNKGKSDNSAVLNAIGPYTTNVQNTFFNDNYVYVASTGIPNYKIGPFPGSALLPGNQRKLNRFPRVSSTISTKDEIKPGPIGTWINGVSIWSYKSNISKTFGALTGITIDDAGQGYDAAFPPSITIAGGGGSGATASVVVNGSLDSIEVTAGGSGYTESPLVSIVGGGGSGATATAIITKGAVSRVLINDGGTGYTSQPTITIVGGGGQGATATAAVRGPIKSISVDSGGSSYTSLPEVQITSGSGAVAQPIVSNGRIISVAIINGGSGYTTAPEIQIQGEGFGAIAKATIDVDGENAGRVTGIEIVNRGIGYVQGTTLINLTSVGQGARFTANIFQWNYNLQSTSTFDAAKGSVFEGFNNQYGGEYAHVSNPQRLRYVLGDNINQTSTLDLEEQDESLEHSPIIGWAFDGNPIYGPYGFEDPTDQSSTIRRLLSSYRLKPSLIYDENTNISPVRDDGPSLSTDVAGTFIEDYEYVFNLGDLDQYNGRFCKTPEFPEGRYVYFVTIDATAAGNPVFPYVLGPSFNSIVDKWNLNADAVQQNIPTGVVRYRDPYENVDIDVERIPNASTNGLTLEDGDLLLFEVEDENRDGVISQDETDDPDQILEESPLQLFDYFPKVKEDSKVDIEVETITKFEDASVTGFSIENPGQNYQVDDRLVFDNTDTDGLGVSARVSRIEGETIDSYTFENFSGVSYGKITTDVPHNLVVGDRIFVDYEPVMANTNKEFVVRQYKGIEEIVVNQTGSGYNSDIPPTITIDGDGESAELQAVVTAVGSIDKVNIINSGNGYTKNPRVILSHPQVFKKTDYFVGLLENDDITKINDIVVTDDKKSYVCGTTKNAAGDTDIAFVAKFSANGTIEWQKTIVNSTGLDYTEFVKLYVDGNEIWVAGQTKPNDSVVDAYNPDIMLVKYTEADNGLSATLNWQKAYAGISGSTRADHITALEKYSDTRFLIGGFTNTNSGNPYDAFIASIDTSGNFAIKRKLSSANASEKLTAMKVVGTDIYFVLETADNASTTNVNLAFGKAQLGTSAIVTSYIKQVVNSVYSFGNTSLSFDEFNEFYVAGDLTLKSDGTTRDSFWVGKFDVDGDLLWNKRYVTGSTIELAPISSIDIFNDFNIAFTKTDDTTGQKIIENVKIKYDGTFLKRTSTDFNINNVEGLSVHGMTTDNSGDVYLAGQTSWNRNEFIFTFNDNTATDITNHYTATVLIGSYGEESLDIEDNVAKIKADDALTGRIRAVDNIDDSYGEIVTVDTLDQGIIGKVLTIDTIDQGTLGDIVTTDTINQGIIGKVLAVTGGTTDANRVAGSYNIGTSDYTTDGSGTGATFTIGVDVNGAITGITITAPGSGFAVSEQITVPDTNLGNGGAADLTFDVSDITDQRAAGTYTIGASDYSVSPTGGTGATFSVVVDGSGNAAITVTDGGSGYSIDDTISISDSNLGGAGAETLTFDVASVTTQRAQGTYNIGASDYTTDGSGTGATFSVVVDGSGNAAVTVTAPGSGFVVDETFSIPDSNLGSGGASALTFDVATRTNQRAAGTYTIGASDYTTDGSGTGATFSVVVDGNGDGAVTVTGIGSGYAVDETITIADSNLGSAGAEAFKFDVASVSLQRTPGTYEIDATEYTTDSASGADATFEITIASDGETTIDIINPGTNYLVNDSFTIADANLGGSGADDLTFDVATIGSTGDWANAAIKIPGTALGTKLSEDWTLEFMLYKYYAGNGDYSQTEHTLLAIGDATDSTGGLWLYYDVATGKLELIVTNNTTSINAATTPLQSGLSNMFADNSWQFIGVKKTGNTFAVYVNGNSVFSGSVTNNSLANKDLHIGNIPGRNGTTGTFRSNEQGQFYADNIRLKNRALDPTVPSDVTTYPSNGQFAENYTWTDTAWFTTNLNRYDYIDYEAFSLKVDKNSDAARLGTISEQTNTEVGFIRTAGTLTSFDLTNTISDYTLGAAGLQTLDYDDVTTTLSQDTETLTQTSDLWSSRTATVPSPGSQKLKVTANVKDRFYFKPTDTLKIDNVQKLTLNQAFNVVDNSKVVLYNNSDAFVNSGYVIRHDDNNLYVAINNNSWTNDLNTGYLAFEKFDEQSTYGIVGPDVAVVNEIKGFTFAQVGFSPSIGTFTIDLSDYDAPDSGGTDNLDEYAFFKSYSTNDYTIRIDETSGSTNFAVGSVITLDDDDISFNTDKSIATITNLTGVSKITVVANLTRILQATAVANTDEVYVVTSSKHYLRKGENVFIDGNVVTGTSEYNGSFITDTIVSPIEFTYKLDAVASTSPAANGAGNVDVFVKSPTLKMYYGHNYIFDVSHSTMLGSNLSFSKDNLYKLEYSFNSISRVGTPGQPGSNTRSTISLKVDKGIVTNISYYFDPSRTGADSPVIAGSYLDVVDSPYKGIFDITAIEGATITTGADIFKFLLVNEPEGNGETTTASYATSSKKAVGSIAAVRIVNPGGFYTRLPVVTNIVSNRNIERVQINDPGTEYAVGTYNSVPIAGDGEGGFVQITVADGQDDEGNTISGQIQAVTVTSPGTGYTTASIDIEAIDGILGVGATGSGADIEVVIPPFGTGASIFTKGDSVGKIKRLKNNNFGYDYPHDYTLRPEITFPINAQLNSTSILESITVTDPGSGYTQAPAVVITGGGGSGAIAEAVVQNGRLSDIIVKDSGSGYSSEPTIELKSSFNYVINLDLGLLQFAFPHGIANGSAVTLNVVDTGDGAEYPLSAGALGRLNGTTTYYAITGAANSLEDDQLKLAISSANAELGDAISFVNAGTGRQQVLTTAFGGVAKANVITSTFLEGELVYQGSSIENATATGFISTNNGWQVGPRIVKIVDYTGEFLVGQSITGVISKSSGVIADLKIAKGVLEIGSITKTTGQFTDDVGKPSEIVQKIQDSYYYQDFSYAVRSAVSINEWKDILIKNVHPASFKVFGELSIDDYGFIPNKETSFQITKSVELAQEAIVPNIQNFALVEPVYSEFNNTEVLFRQKRLTSSENILTSTVQTLDNISNLFDGVETAFPLTVNQQPVIANENQLMIILNGVVQTPGTAFNVVDNLLVFAEPPQPPASVRYVTITFNQKSLTDLEFTNISGIFPNIGNVLVGSTTTSRFTVTQVEGDTIRGFYSDLGSNNNGFTSQEFVTGNTTGFNGNFDTSTAVENIGLFIFGETVRNFDDDRAVVEQVNLERGQETPISQLRFGIGLSTTTFEVIARKTSPDDADAPVAEGQFVVGKKYQVGPELFEIVSITQGTEATTLEVIRGVNNTTAQSHLEDTPVYKTEISVTNTMTLSKTIGTYQSTPGLYSIQDGDTIIGLQSGVVVEVVTSQSYEDPITETDSGSFEISEGSNFFGLLFNRIASVTYPNVILDDIATSQVSILDFDDNLTPYDTKFPSTEPISNNILTYDNASGALQDNENIRNYKFEYGNNVGDFQVSEPAYSRKLTFKDLRGDGLFKQGQVIRTDDTKAEVIGYAPSDKTIYLGKVGRSKGTGEDYHHLTFNGDAQLDTDQKKFGATSLLLDGTGDYISIPTSTEFGFGTTDFTIECYIRPANVTGAKAIFDFRTTGTEVSPYLYLDGTNLKYFVNNLVVWTGNTTLAADTWYHVALVKSSGTTKVYVNGALDGASNYVDGNDYGSTKPLRIGATIADGDYFNGHIDELRVSVNARYTDAFTPQQGIFQGDANSKLLVHFDGADADTYVEDWSGTESFGNGEFFNNDAIRATSLARNSLVQVTQRYYDAAGLIRRNLDYIANEVVYLMKEKFPYFTIPGGEVACEDDIRDVLRSMISDLENGSNSHVWDAAALYVDRTTNPISLSHVESEITETIWAYGKVKEILEYIINNDIWDTQGDHGLKQLTDATITDSSYTTLTSLTPTGATYDPATGDMVVTAASHGLVGPTTHTPTAANYVPATGIMTLTIANHGFANGDKVQIANAGLTFTCAMDGNTAQKTYPRRNDPGSLGWLKISNVTTNTFDINVGVSLNEYYTVTAVDYDPANNKAVLTIGDHELRPGTSIKLQNESLTFTCATDNHQTEHSYPRSGDGNYDTAINIVNNGSSHDVNTATYNAQTGVMVLTAQKGSISNSAVTTIGSGYSTATGVALTGGTGSGATISITSVGGGVGDIVEYTVTNAGTGYTKNDVLTVPGGNGDARITISQIAHGWSVGDKIRIEDNSLTFTCDSDNNYTNHTYPRSTDPFSGRWLRISAVTPDTYTVNVGDAGTASNFIHTFVSAAANAVTYRDGTITINLPATTDVSEHIFVRDELIGGNGAVVAGGNYAHTFVSAVADSITKQGDAVTIADGSFRFTCTSDGNDRELAHPRPSDTHVYRRVLPITAHTTNTFTLDVGESPDDAQFAHTFVDVDTNAITVVDYSTADCADVYTTAGTLVDIITDTLSNANLATPVDHLATVTKHEPAHEYAGATVDAYLEVPFTVSYSDAANDILYTNQIDADTRYRFRDAANLLRLNTSAIIDKTSYDLLQRYPDLASEIPRNEDGSGDGTERCKTDLTLIIAELINDLEIGGNYDTIRAAKFYLDNNNALVHIGNQIQFSIYAHNRLGYYMKQAINGDLTTDNTDAIITGDWGITNDPGNCANVENAIDTLITTLNDALAPTSEDFAIAADRVYFNRDYIANEITGLTTAEFTYQLNGVNFNAFVYPGSDGLTKCERDIKLIIRAMLSDLQTGGTNATIDVARLYLDANNHINHIEEELLATLYAFEQIKVIGEYAIKNNLLDQGQTPGAGQYAAQHTTETAYTDSETPTDIDEVVYRFRELVDILLGILAPAGQSARSAGKNILYNQNYYDEELQSIVNAQFGAGSWSYDSFVDEITKNVVHDLITTDTTDKQTATKVVVTGASDDFTIGELVIGGTGGGYYKVLEWDEDAGILYLGPKLGGTAFTASEVLTGRQSNATATTSSTGTTFDWYNKPGNVRTRDTADGITSLIAGEVAGTNLWTNPEDFSTNWSSSNSFYTANAATAPDGSQTADHVKDNTNNTPHSIFRTYNLTALQTFDTSGVTFDSGTESFDTGSVTATQTYTLSFFVKRAEYEKIKFEYILDAGTGATEKKVFFQFDSLLGTKGNLFTNDAIRVEQEGVKTIANIAVTTTAAMTGTYTGLSATGAAAGTGATFDVTINHENAPNTATITINNDGVNYDIGDTLTIAAADINGANASNDLTFDVSEIFNANVGVIPFGDGWYRLYITGEFGFGFSTLRQQVYVLNGDGQETYAGTGNNGVYLWGAKLNKGELDPYVSVSGETFFSNKEYNIKTLILNSMIGWMSESLDNTLTSPSPETTTYTFYDSTAAADYNTESIRRTIRYLLEIVKEQLGNSNYVNTIEDQSGITIPTYTYGDRNIPTGLLGGISATEYFYGSYTGSYAELKVSTLNEAFIAKVFKRFRIDGDITDGPYTMNEVVQKQGDATVTGVVYGFHEDENYKYLDVAVTAGTWAITDIIEGQTNTTTAQLSAIEDRLHLINLQGTFSEDIPFKAYTSGETATPIALLNNNASVLANTGGRLTVDTEGLTGTFETTSVVYPNTSREYLDLQSYAGLELNVGDRIGSDGHQRLQISIVTSQGVALNNFTEGNRIYKVVSGGQVSNVFGFITDVDLDNNFIYVKMVQGTLALGDFVGDYGALGGDFPVGYATISTIVTNAGAATGLIQNIQTIGGNKRIYLTDIRGTFSERDAIIGPNGHKSIILDRDILKARVKRFFRGFDGTTTNFKLTTGNGTQYLPDPEGHLLIFINGILQPPGATNAFTAFSDQIQFTEAPEAGASFTGFYVGKLRQLDDISFEFDSLRQSFNLKRNEVFYSLTLTDGVQSTTIRPENNIIVSLNGVIQEPGVGFEVVGSRIIFSEIPRVGSTFVAFSYVGSEADVDAAEVVPSIESGDLIRIQGETSDREVAIIESSNSLITFDYLGSVFGRDASATPTLTSQFIESVRVTAGGSGYTSKPAIIASSITGSGAEITPLIGVAGIELSSVGSGYQPPVIDVETSVPDDWTAPDLSQYGEELVDPEL